MHVDFGNRILAASRSFAAGVQPARRYLRALVAACALASAAMLPNPGAAAPVSIPNADFSAAANSGSIGGGLIGDSGSGPIGSGPWAGAYAGVAALLAPPQLTIAPGQGTISGIAVGVLGVANSGEFKQDLAANYAPVKHYVLEADVTAGSSILALNALTGGNVGLALKSGTTTLSSTHGASAITLQVLANDTFHIALGYDSAASDSGSIGVSLFSNPTGVLAANLVSTITFRSVELTQAPIPALPPNHIAPATGTPQAAVVNTAFAAPLVVRVEDAEGDPLAGIEVTFSAPSTGASANLSATTVVTDVAGEAIVTGTANGIAGRYTVVASVSGLQQVATFDLTNSGSAPAITSVTGGDLGQAATVGATFQCMLAVKVIAGAAPAAGATVVFAAPFAGASATLSDGVVSGPLLLETTDANGMAAVAATANSTAGTYDVTAYVTALTSGVLATPVLVATYPLTNLVPGERTFADGFEEVPALCGSF